MTDTKAPDPTPTVDPRPVIVQVFNDVERKFELGAIDVNEIVEIAVKPTLLPPKATTIGFLAYRIGLGPGKWAYVDAIDIDKLRDAYSPKP